MNVQMISNFFTYAPKTTKALAYTVMGATIYKIALNNFVTDGGLKAQGNLKALGFSALNGKNGIVFNKKNEFQPSSLLYTPHILVGLLNYYTKGYGGYAVSALSVAGIYFNWGSK